MSLSMDSVLKKLGNEEAVKSIARTQLSEEEIRGGPIELIKHAFTKLQKEGIIHSGAKLKPFRLGWRGVPITYSHGKMGTYSQGCRCDLCRDAWRVYYKERRREKAKLYNAAIARAFMTPFVTGAGAEPGTGLEPGVADGKK